MADLPHLKARHAAYRRHREPDDPEAIAAERDLKAGVLEQHIRAVVDEAPPLTDEQRNRLAAILRPVAS